MTNLLNVVDKVLGRRKRIHMNDAPLVALKIGAEFPEGDVALIEHLVKLRIIERGKVGPLSRRTIRPKF